MAVTSHIRQTLDRCGRRIHEEFYPQKMTSWELMYYVLRANFDGHRSKYCEVPAPMPGEGKTEYLFGHFVVGLEDVGNQVEVEYQDNNLQKKTASADLVLGADGQSSLIRKKLLSEIERTYAGYVAWRGLLPESEVSKTLKSTFEDHFTFYHGPGIQILA